MYRENFQEKVNSESRNSKENIHKNCEMINCLICLDCFDNRIKPEHNQEQQAQIARQCKMMQNQLGTLLRTHVFPKQFSLAYPTIQGKLALPGLHGTLCFEII